MVKRVLSCVLSLALLMLCLPLGAVSVAAAESVTLSTTAAENAVCLDEEIVFTVSLDKEVTVSALAIKLGVGYDATLFDFVSAEWLIDGVLSDVDTEKMNAVLAFATPSACGGDVLTFTLRAKDDANFTNTTVCADAVIKLEAEELAVTTVGAAVSVADHDWNGTNCKNCDATRELDEILVSTEVYGNITFDVYEKADGTHKLVISGQTKMGGWTNRNAYQYAATITEVVVNEGVTELAYGAFRNMAALRSVTIPSTVTAIPAVCFSGCKALTSFEIPSTITSIGNKAFQSSGITSVTIPDGVLLGIAVWMDCKNLTFADIGAIKHLPDGDTKLRSWLPQQTFMNCTKLTDVVFDKKVLTIHKATFSNTGITEITIPGHIATVSDSAFAACANLTKVVLEENVTYLGWQALAGCAKLSDVTLPSTLVTFGARAFASCYELEEITLPQNTTKLPADLLFGCTALKSVDWSHLSVTDVPSRAVYKCLALTEVKLPETIKTIGKLAFYNCRTLPSITIPANVTTITSQAFNYCLALKMVYIDSATVVKGLTSRDAMGELVRYADTVAINASITDVPAYITSTFTVVGSETVDGVEYVTYSKA